MPKLFLETKDRTVSILTIRGESFLPEMRRSYYYLACNETYANLQMKIDPTAGWRLQEGANMKTVY